MGIYHVGRFLVYCVGPFLVYSAQGRENEFCQIRRVCNSALRSERNFEKLRCLNIFGCTGITKIGHHLRKGASNFMQMKTSQDFWTRSPMMRRELAP